MSRHDRRAEASARRRMRAVSSATTAAEAAEHNVLCVIVSYRGLDGLTSENLEQIKDTMLGVGHGFAHKTIRRTPLDLARNESFTLVRSTQATSALFLDDDCQVDPHWLPRALALLDAGLDVVTAPVRLRGEEIVFNIDPIGLPVDVAGERVMPVRWTGFGCVLMKRSVIDTMHEKLPSLHYESQRYEGMTSAAIFQSAIVPNKILGMPGDPASRRYVLDDRIWSLRAAALGIKVHATIDVDACHDGYVGNFGKMFDRCIICSGCREELPTEDFSSSEDVPDGSNLRCLQCDSTTGLVNTHRPLSAVTVEVA
jgi:hypothetical protein